MITEKTSFSIFMPNNEMRNQNTVKDEIKIIVALYLCQPFSV
jgi:hypothetical protein